MSKSTGVTIAYLTANQAWVTLFNGNPISIRDTTFWNNRSALVANLNDVGLDVQKDGTMRRWCPVGRDLPGQDVTMAFLPVCDQHATDDSRYCEAHTAVYR